MDCEPTKEKMTKYDNIDFQITNCKMVYSKYYSIQRLFHADFLTLRMSGCLFLCT